MDRKEAIETMVLKREKIIGTISSLPPKSRERSNLNKEIEAYTKAITALQEPEQKKGRWIECFEDWRKQISGYKCSVCGFEHYGNVFGFCPNCGADMRQVRNNGR